MAREASTLAMSYYGNAKSWDKEDATPVTEADLAIDQFIQKEIAKNFPQDACLSEEAKDNKKRLEQDYVWIIDPIDGTKGFIQENGEFAVMIGLTYKGKTSFGVVALPASNEIFYGGTNLGIHCQKDDKDIELPPFNPTGNRVFLSRHHLDPKVKDFVDKMNYQSLSCGSVGVKVCRILQGKGEHYIHSSNVGEWDTAAPEALLKAAGGTFVGQDGKELTYNKIIPKTAGMIASINPHFPTLFLKDFS